MRHPTPSPLSRSYRPGHAPTPRSGPARARSAGPLLAAALALTLWACQTSEVPEPEAAPPTSPAMQPRRPEPVPTECVPADEDTFWLEPMAVDIASDRVTVRFGLQALPSTPDAPAPEVVVAPADGPCTRAKLQTGTATRATALAWSDAIRGATAERHIPKGPLYSATVPLTPSAVDRALCLGVRLGNGLTHCSEDGLLHIPGTAGREWAFYVLGGFGHREPDRRRATWRRSQALVRGVTDDVDASRRRAAARPPGASGTPGPLGAAPPALAVLTGDLASAGCDVDAWRRDALGPLAPLAEALPMVSVPGDLERGGCPEADAWRALFDPDPGAGGGPPALRHVDVKNARLLMVDTTTEGRRRDLRPGGQTRAELERRIARAGDVGLEHVFLILHGPLLDAGAARAPESRRTAEELVDALGDLTAAPAAPGVGGVALGDRPRVRVVLTGGPRGVLRSAPVSDLCRLSAAGCSRAHPSCRPAGGEPAAHGFPDVCAAVDSDAGVSVVAVGAAGGPTDAMPPGPMPRAWLDGASDMPAAVKITVRGAEVIGETLPLDEVGGQVPIETFRLVAARGRAIVPEGPTWRGCAEGRDRHCHKGADDRPAHPVWLSTFEIDRFQVTVGEWLGCVAAGQCSSAAAPPFGAAGARRRLPMTGVTWQEAAAYCSWRGARLPTEAEWEKAARGGCAGDRGACRATLPVFPWGDEPAQCRVAVMADPRVAKGPQGEGCGNRAPMPVGSRPFGDSPFGVADMAGNAYDWVYDWYAPYGREAQTNPAGPESGRQRVARGGDWASGAFWQRASYRRAMAPGARDPDVGFRCARPLDQRATTPGAEGPRPR